MHRPHLPPPSKYAWYTFLLRGWVEPRVLVQLEGLWKWEIPMTPTWIKTATFQFVAQCLNQLYHYMPPLYSKAGQQNSRTTGDSEGMCAAFMCTTEGSRGSRLLHWMTRKVIHAYVKWWVNTVKGHINISMKPFNSNAVNWFASLLRLEWDMKIVILRTTWCVC